MQKSDSLSARERASLYLSQDSEVLRSGSSSTSRVFPGTLRVGTSPICPGRWFSPTPRQRLKPESASTGASLPAARRAAHRRLLLKLKSSLLQEKPRRPEQASGFYFSTPPRRQLAPSWHPPFVEPTHPLLLHATEDRNRILLASVPPGDSRSDRSGPGIFDPGS